MSPLQTNQIRFCVGVTDRGESSSRKTKPQIGTKDPQGPLSIQPKLMESPSFSSGSPEEKSALTTSFACCAERLRCAFTARSFVIAHQGVEDQTS
jgi:hypothetical protein